MGDDTDARTGRKEEHPADEVRDIAKSDNGCQNWFTRRLLVALERSFWAGERNSH